MANPLPITSQSLLSRLRDEGNETVWQVSWKRFVELYHTPLIAIAAAIYRSHTGHAVPSQQFLEDTVSKVVIEFFTKKRFDPHRGRLRTYLRMLTNAKVVDALRKDGVFNHRPFEADESAPELKVPSETPAEKESFERSLLNTLIEDLRSQIPMRHFEIFEMVKLREMRPDQVAEELGVKRNVVDNTVYKVMKRLREISAKPEYREEYYP
jgi:RNA polymerase sigma factor (sigma-70 family)